MYKLSVSKHPNNFWNVLFPKRGRASSRCWAQLCPSRVFSGNVVGSDTAPQGFPFHFLYPIFPCPLLPSGTISLPGFTHLFTNPERLRGRGIPEPVSSLASSSVSSAISAHAAPQNGPKHCNFPTIFIQIVGNFPMAPAPNYKRVLGNAARLPRSARVCEGGRNVGMRWQQLDTNPSKNGFLGY